MRLPVVAPFPCLLGEMEWLRRLPAFIGMHLLWMFFSHRIQQLRSRWTKMWTYPGPSCPDHPSSDELSVAEVEAWIDKVLDLGVNPTPSAGPIPLQRGIASVRVSTLGPVLVAFTILSFQCTRDLT
jgi:hypothetical protein